MVEPLLEEDDEALEAAEDELLEATLLEAALDEELEATLLLDDELATLLDEELDATLLEEEEELVPQAAAVNTAPFLPTPA